MLKSIYFKRFRRGIAHQRKALLKDGGPTFFYEPHGIPWTPNMREQSLSDAFIFFVAAELETYFESVLGDIFDFHEKCSTLGPSSVLGSHSKMHEGLLSVKTQLAKNNNTRWDRIKPLWKFIGIGRDRFPGDFWDHVEHITSYRGDVAHQSWGIRSFTDPRIVFRHIEQLFPLMERFDRDFMNCRERQKEFLVTLSRSNVGFISGLGTISTAH